PAHQGRVHGDLAIGQALVLRPPLPDPVLDLHLVAELQVVLLDVGGHPGPHPRVQLVAGAAGRVHVAVPELGQAPPGPADSLVVQPPDGPLRRRRRVTVAADHAHPDTRRVVAGGVRALHEPPAALVDPALDVDQEVIADVRPAPAVHVEVLDAPHRLSRGAFGVVHDELAPVPPRDPRAGPRRPGPPLGAADDLHGGLLAGGEVDDERGDREQRSGAQPDRPPGGGARRLQVTLDAPHAVAQAPLVGLVHLAGDGAGGGLVDTVVHGLHVPVEPLMNRGDRLAGFDMVAFDEPLQLAERRVVGHQVLYPTCIHQTAVVVELERSTLTVSPLADTPDAEIIWTMPGTEVLAVTNAAKLSPCVVRPDTTSDVTVLGVGVIDTIPTVIPWTLPKMDLSACAVRRCPAKMPVTSSSYRAIYTGSAMRTSAPAFWSLVTPLTPRTTVNVCGDDEPLIWVTVMRSPATTMSNGKSAGSVVHGMSTVATVRAVSLSPTSAAKVASA